MCHEENEEKKSKERKWGQETRHKEQPGSVFLKDTVLWEKETGSNYLMKERKA